MELKRCRTIASLVFIVMVILSVPVFAGTWSRKADVPGPSKMDSEVGIVGGIIYNIGGQGFAHAVEAYDPAADTWSRKANIPTPRLEHGVSVVDGIIYAIGGLTPAQPYQKENNGDCSAVEAYDPGTDTWTRKAEMPIPTRAMKTEAVDGIIYAFGGRRSRKDKAGVWQNSSEPDVYAYDPATDTWTRKADMPSTRAWFGSCVLNGEIYAAGGWYQYAFGSYDQINRTNLCSIYNPRSDTWRRGAPPGAIRANANGGQAVVALNEKIYILGGTNSTDGRVWIYDPTLNTVVRGPSMMVPTRAYFAAITLDEKIYLIGGWQQNAKVQVGNRTDVYNPFAAPPAHQIRSVEVKDKLITEWGTLKIAE